MSGSQTPEELSELVKDRDTGQNTLQDKYGGIEGMAKHLHTDLSKGLHESEIEERKKTYGENVLPTKPPTPFWRFLLDALKDKTLIILSIASVVSIVLGLTMPPPGESRETGWIEGTAILIAVVVVASVTALNDWSKDKKFRQLSAVSEDRKIKILRDGKSKVVSVFDIAVGDVIVLETGDFIPADALYITGQGLVIDESSMTGEPEGVRKSEEDPWLLGGTMVTEGQAHGLVITVGVQTQWGKIKATLEKPEVKTPLQVKLENLAENIGKLGLVAAILTLVALILKWSITKFAIHKEPWQWSEVGILVNYVITAITIIVVAVPEGLPLAVTLSLAYSMMRMMKDQNLVRHLAACETMGGATNICSDKTGTLTQNKMTVVKLKIGNQVLENVSEEEKDKMDEGLRNLLTEAVCLNSTAYIMDRESDKPTFVGPKTEGALLVMAEKFGTDYEEVRNRVKVERVYPFSSKKKRMSTVVRTDKGRRLYVKGAAEVMLDLCTNIEGTDANGNWKEEYSSLIEEWASEGLRTLTIAYKDLSGSESTQSGASHPSHGKEERREEPAKAKEEECPYDTDLTLLGVVGIEDPLRPEVIDSVKECQKAGITVRMVTGDNLLTAKKIAKTCGILKADGCAVEGPKWRNMTHDQIDKIIPNLQVIARCSPEDKLILVKRLKEMGEVVACTGDGTNDAPILREADVGFAMGISGTEVAKEACDIILLDDNFSSIEKAVLWGRNVYDSIRKFVQFQLTVNIVAVAVAFIGAVTTGDSPLTAIQLLWVNLIMDTMAALALATEPPTKELMDRKPYGRNNNLITWAMWRNIIGQALFQLGVLLFLLYGAQYIPFLGISSEDNARRTTIIFNTFVFCQLFNEINCRKLGNEINVFKHFFNNWIFIAIMAFTIVVQVVLVEFGGTFAKTTHLNLYQWLFCVGVAALSILIGSSFRDAINSMCRSYFALDSSPRRKGSCGRSREDKTVTKGRNYYSHGGS